MLQQAPPPSSVSKGLSRTCPWQLHMKIEGTYRETQVSPARYTLRLVCVCDLNLIVVSVYAPANRWGIEFECLLRKAWLKLLALLSPNNREISCLRTVRTGSATSFASDTVNKRDDDMTSKTINRRKHRKTKTSGFKRASINGFTSFEEAH